MSNVIQNQSLSAAFLCGQNLPSVRALASSVVNEASYLAQEAIAYTADVLFDCSRAVSYTAQWIGYSNLSSGVKESADRVRNATDRFNLFASFCEVYSSGKAFMDTQIETVSDAVNSIGACIASSSEFAGRLDDFRIVSLGDLKPLAGGVEGLAGAALGVNGIRDVLQDPEIDKSWTSSMIKLAKNVSLVALSTLAGVASYFTTFAAGCSYLSLSILVMSTTYLAIKTAGVFYDKLALPTPLEVAVKV